MPNKNHRSGGKVTGSHTTLTPFAASIVDVVHKCPEVYKISIGFIKSGLPSARGKRRIKITRVENGCLRLAIRDNISHQQVFIYTMNSEITLLAIMRAAHNLNAQTDIANT